MEITPCRPCGKMPEMHKHGKHNKWIECSCGMRTKLCSTKKLARKIWKGENK